MTWIFLWDTAPSKIFVWDSQVSKVFVWDTQVWPTGLAERPNVDSYTLSSSYTNSIARLHAIWIAWDGEYLYIGRDTASLSEYVLTNWDVANFDNSVQSGVVYQSRWLWVKNDWTKLFNSHDNGNIYETSMNTPYSLTWTTTVTNAMWYNCCGIGLSYDWTKLYHWVWDNNYSHQFIEYTLSTPRDVSSHWTGVANTVNAIQTARDDGSFIYQVAVSPTGKKMYFSADQWKIYQYNLSTAYDWSTATYYWVLDTWLGQRISFQFREDWQRIYVWNVWNKYLYQYDAS
jgi:hypothetical protein